MPEIDARPLGAVQVAGAGQFPRHSIAALRLTLSGGSAARMPASRRLLGSLTKRQRIFGRAPTIDSPNGLIGN